LTPRSSTISLSAEEAILTNQSKANFNEEEIKIQIPSEKSAAYNTSSGNPTVPAQASDEGDDETQLSETDFSEKASSISSSLNLLGSCAGVNQDSQKKTKRQLYAQTIAPTGYESETTSPMKLGEIEASLF